MHSYTKEEIDTAIAKIRNLYGEHFEPGKGTNSLADEMNILVQAYDELKKNPEHNTIMNDNDKNEKKIESMVRFLSQRVEDSYPTPKGTEKAIWLVLEDLQIVRQELAKMTADRDQREQEARNWKQAYDNAIVAKTFQSRCAGCAAPHPWNLETEGVRTAALCSSCAESGVMIVDDLQQLGVEPTAYMVVQPGVATYHTMDKEKALAEHARYGGALIALYRRVQKTGFDLFVEEQMKNPSFAESYRKMFDEVKAEQDLTLQIEALKNEVKFQADRNAELYQQEPAAYLMTLRKDGDVVRMATIEKAGIFGPGWTGEPLYLRKS